MPLYNLGSILLEKNQPNAAFNFLKKAIENKPEFADIHNNLGIALVKLNKRDKALTVFEHALKLNPNLLNARINLSTLLLEKHNESEALKNILTVLQREPQNVNALFILGNIHLERKEFLKAIKIYKSISPLKRYDPFFHYKFALALSGKGLLRKSKEHLQKVLLLKPDWVMAKEKLFQR